MNALRSLIAPLAVGGRFFRHVRYSGSHEDSLTAIQCGTADVAAIDCIVYRLLERIRPSALLGLRVLCETPSAIAPPFVTSMTTNPAIDPLLFAALRAALPIPELGLTEIQPIDRTAYEPMVQMARDAAAVVHELLPSEAASGSLMSSSTENQLETAAVRHDRMTRA